MTQDRRVFSFGGGTADGRADMRDLLGGKGANLAEMSLLGLPVPPGFTLTTDICTWYNAHDKNFPDGLEDDVTAALTRLSEDLGASFGDTKNPLLVSVRSGSRASMPGMMDTVLNLALLMSPWRRWLGWRCPLPPDSYRRFMQMYGDVVGVAHDFFEEALDDYKLENVVTQDAELDADDWKEVCRRYRDVIEAEGQSFPVSCKRNYGRDTLSRRTAQPAYLLPATRPMARVRFTANFAQCARRRCGGRYSHAALSDPRRTRSGGHGRCFARRVHAGVF